MDTPWYNAEDNSDLDTSNESYMSSSDDDDDRNCRELSREEKALFGRRFEPYFYKIRLPSDEFFRRGR